MSLPRRSVVPVFLLGFAFLLLPLHVADSGDDVDTLKATITRLERDLRMEQHRHVSDVTQLQGELARVNESLETQRVQMTQSQQALAAAQQARTADAANLFAQLAEANERRNALQIKLAAIEQSLMAEQQAHTYDVTMLQQMLTKANEGRNQLMIKRVETQQALAQLVADIGEPAVPALLGRLDVGTGLTPIDVVSYLRAMGAKAKSALPRLRALADDPNPPDEALAKAADRAVDTIEDALEAAK